MIRADKSLSMRSAIFLMSAVAVARGSSFIFSKQLLAGGMEPLNLLGVRSMKNQEVADFILSQIKKWKP